MHTPMFTHPPIRRRVTERRYPLPERKMHDLVTHPLVLTAGVGVFTLLVRW